MTNEEGMRGIIAEKEPWAEHFLTPKRHVATITKGVERAHTQPSRQSIKNDHVKQKTYSQEAQWTYIQNSKTFELRQNANLNTL